MPQKQKKKFAFLITNAINTVVPPPPQISFTNPPNTSIFIPPPPTLSLAEYHQYTLCKKKLITEKWQRTITEWILISVYIILEILGTLTVGLWIYLLVPLTLVPFWLNFLCETQSHEECLPEESWKIRPCCYVR